MMLAELEALLACVDSPEAAKADYRRAVEEDNCLGKRSQRNRALTFRHLTDLYGLDPSLCLFRSLVYFWRRDADGHPMLALMCAYARDSVLRASLAAILELSPGQALSRVQMESHIDSLEPGRYSPVMLTTTAQHVNGTWTESGHLAGRAHKTRRQATATAGSAAYALLVGYLTGARGPMLFQTDYMALLDCSRGRAVELAAEAGRAGWIVFRRIGDVIDARFPEVLTDEEMRWVSEQG